MDMNAAIDGLSALALAGRLEIFRLLVKTGAEGMAAGDIARAIDARPNTLSANNVLELEKASSGGSRLARDASAVSRISRPARAPGDRCRPAGA